MLTCVYHPLDHMRVVEEDEAERLKESGVWFDCPAKAKAYRHRVANDLKKEKTKAKGQIKETKNERE